MVVRYLKKTSLVGLIKNKEYEVLSIEKDWYRIIDESGEKVIKFIKDHSTATTSNIIQYVDTLEGIISDSGAGKAGRSKAQYAA